MTTMHNPPHPGEFIHDIYLEPNGISVRRLAEKLCVSPSTLARIVQSKAAVSSEMALRLAKTLGRSPESWLALQTNYDLWRARQTLDLANVKPMDFDAA